MTLRERVGIYKLETRVCAIFGRKTEQLAIGNLSGKKNTLPPRKYVANGVTASA